jgi:hypothetical protein
MNDSMHQVVKSFPVSLSASCLALLALLLRSLSTPSNLSWHALSGRVTLFDCESGPLGTTMEIAAQRTVRAVERAMQFLPTSLPANVTVVPPWVLERCPGSSGNCGNGCEGGKCWFGVGFMQESR